MRSGGDPLLVRADELPLAACGQSSDGQSCGRDTHALSNQPASSRHSAGARSRILRACVQAQLAG